MYCTKCGEIIELGEPIGFVRGTDESYHLLRCPCKNTARLSGVDSGAPSMALAGGDKGVVTAAQGATDLPTVSRE